VRSVRSALTVVTDLVAGKSRDGKAAGRSVIKTERRAMKAGTAVVMMIQRTFAIVRVVIMRVTAFAIVVLMGAHMTAFLKGDDTGAQSGEDAENEEPCQKEPHDESSDRPWDG
jgi:hypothetical protein